LTSYRHTSEAYYRYLGSISSSSQFKLYPSHSCHLQQYVNALAARNETRRLNVQVMMVIMLQVCMGAQHLQSQSIVHRSMSATNIFIDKDTTVKVGGLYDAIHLIDEHGPVPYSNASQLTINTTELLQAPEIRIEQYRHSAALSSLSSHAPSSSPPLLLRQLYDRADIWSIGTMMYHLFGTSYFHQEAAVNLAVLIQRAPICYYSDNEIPILQGRDIPISLSTLLVRMVSCEPSRRPSGNECVALLQLMLWGPSDLEISLLTSLESCEQWLDRARLAMLLLQQSPVPPIVGALPPPPPAAAPLPMLPTDSILNSTTSPNVNENKGEAKEKINGIAATSPSNETTAAPSTWVGFKNPTEKFPRFDVDSPSSIAASPKLAAVAAMPLVEMATDRHSLAVAFVLRSPQHLWNDIQIYQRIILNSDFSNPPISPPSASSPPST
jgi:serine/threonine protein kinase